MIRREKRRYLLLLVAVAGVLQGAAIALRSHSAKAAAQPPQGRLFEKLTVFDQAGKSRLEIDFDPFSDHGPNLLGGSLGKFSGVGAARNVVLFDDDGEPRERVGLEGVATLFLNSLRPRAVVELTDVPVLYLYGEKGTLRAELLFFELGIPHLSFYDVSGHYRARLSLTGQGSPAGKSLRTVIDLKADGSVPARLRFLDSGEHRRASLETGSDDNPILVFNAGENTFRAYLTPLGTATVELLDRESKVIARVP
jgi:hypothetical protein